jgi:membrane protein YqaA with SNARE-associated domain
MNFNQKALKKSTLFAGSFAGLVLLSIWSFFEASFWFIAPDFLIAIFSFLVPKKYKKYIFLALLFTLLGGIAYYSLNIFYLENMTLILQNTLFVSEKNIDFVSKILTQYGVGGSFFQSFTLIPFKIWTNLVVILNLNPLIYFVIVIFSRLIRFTIIAGIAILARKKLGNLNKKYFLIIAIVYLILFFSIMFLLEY